MTHNHDIFRFDIQAPLAELSLALELAFRVAPGRHKSAVGFSVDFSNELPKLVFYWAEHSDMIRFFVRFEARELTSMVENWCREVHKDIPDLGNEGTVELGFRVFNENGGLVTGNWEAICAVEPAYLYYGK